MTKPRLRLSANVRAKQTERRERVLPSTWSRNKFVQRKGTENPARILPAEFEFGPLFTAVMSLQTTHFYAGAHLLTTHGHMLHGWKPPQRFYRADKSRPSISTAPVPKNKGDNKRKKQASAASARGPPHKPPPVPPAPKMQEDPIVMHRLVCEVPPAFVPPQAEAGGTATDGQSREAKMLVSTEHYLNARNNSQITPGEKRARFPTDHTRY
jgi:hypothetical protein